MKRTFVGLLMVLSLVSVMSLGAVTVVAGEGARDPSSPPEFLSVREKAMEASPSASIPKAFPAPSREGTTGGLIMSRATHLAQSGVSTAPAPAIRGKRAQVPDGAAGALANPGTGSAPADGENKAPPVGHRESGGAAALRMDEVVVTATRDWEEVRRVPADVSVITEEDIKKSGATSLVEVLEKLEGIQIRSYSGQSPQAMVDLRGFGGDNPFGKTLVLIDGRRQNRPDMSSNN